jgi:fucose permease
LNSGRTIRGSDSSERQGRVDQGSEPHFTRRRVTWLLYVLVGYFGYLESLLGPIMPFIRAEQGYSYTLASLHFSGFALGSLLAGLTSDHIARALGRRAALWGGGLAMLGGATLLAVGDTEAATLPGTLLMGGGGFLVLVMTQAALADHHPRWSAVAITESNVAASACSIGAALAVGAFAASPAGWRAALIPPAAVLLCAWVAWRGQDLGVARASAPERARQGMPRRFWALWIVLFAGVSVEWCMAYWAPDYLENKLLWTRPAAAAALSVHFAAMLLGRVVGSRIARRIEPGRLLVATLGLALAGFLAFWLTGLTWTVLGGLFITGLGVASIYPVSVSLGIATTPGRTDTAAARLGVAGAAALLLSPFALGAVADRLGISDAYGVVLPLLLAGLWLAWRIKAHDS